MDQPETSREPTGEQGVSPKDASPPLEPVSLLRQDAHGTRPARIIWLDDEESVVKECSYVFARRLINYTLISCRNGDEALREIDRHPPEFSARLKRAGDRIIQKVTGVGDVLLSVADVFPDTKEPVSLASLTAEAYQKLKLYQGEKAPLQLVCKGPDDLAFATGNLGRLRTLFTEILLDVDHPSNSVTVQWAEDHERLGVPTAKVEFATGGVKVGAGFGLCVAEELTLDMHGCMAFTVGKPGTLSLWLPLTPP